MNRRPLRFLRLSFLLAAVCLPLTAQQATPSPAAANAEKMELIRSELSRALEMEQIIAREETDWKLGKEVLVNRIAFLENQIRELHEKSKEESGKMTTADEETKARVRALETRALKLLPALPAPLVEKVVPLAARLPKPEMKDEEI